MKKDPIIAEVRKAGENMARTAGYDVHTFFNHLREKEKQHINRLVMRKAKELKLDDYGVLVATHSDGGFVVLVDRESPEYKFTEATCR